jgi:two-component system sensor histidine kinase PrrB
VSRLSSIRVQLSIAGALIVFVVVACAGLAIAVQVNRSDRAQLDAALLDRSSRAERDFEETQHERGAPRPPPERGRDHDLFGPDTSLVRVIVDGQVTDQSGLTPDVALPLPRDDGFATVSTGAQRWRSYVRTAGGRRGTQVQVLQNLEPLEERITRVNVLVLIVTAAATAFGAAAGWFTAGFLLRPLQRVRAAAVAIRDDRDVGHRLPDVTRPREVADLTDTLNGMLDRLQTSTATARRFTADAGHELRTPLTSLGAYIETLNRPTEPTQEVRQRIATEMQVEYQRLVDLLNGLQSLARGDAGALPAFADVDVRQLVEDASRAARRRHPTVSIRASFDESYPLVSGWAEGIRLAIDNLLNNAALHGRQAGTVSVDVTTTNHVVTVAVNDDGPGISPEQRSAMMTRFARGADATPKGSGLGLALVLQQAEIHHGALELGDSGDGGLSARLSLPTVDESTVS